MNYTFTYPSGVELFGGFNYRPGNKGQADQWVQGTDMQMGITWLNNPQSTTPFYKTVPTYSYNRGWNWRFYNGNEANATVTINPVVWNAWSEWDAWEKVYDMTDMENTIMGWKDVIANATTTNTEALNAAKSELSTTLTQLAGAHALVMSAAVLATLLN